MTAFQRDSAAAKDLFEAQRDFIRARRPLQALVHIASRDSEPVAPKGQTP